jgi:hypothetical protein
MSEKQNDEYHAAALTAGEWWTVHLALSEIADVYAEKGDLEQAKAFERCRIKLDCQTEAIIEAARAEVRAAWVKLADMVK